MHPIRTSRPQTPSHAEAFGIADEVAHEYFQRQYADRECHLHATGWRFHTCQEPDGALLNAAQAGAMTQEQMRLQIQDYLRKTPLETTA